MGVSFTAVPSAIAQSGRPFMEEGEQLSQSASSFGGGAGQVADAFGLLGACDGAKDKYTSMTQSTTQGLEQLAQLWEHTGEELAMQAESYQALEDELVQLFESILKALGI